MGAQWVCPICKLPNSTLYSECGTVGCVGVQPDTGTPDPVNAPSHYVGTNGIECIDAVRAMTTPEGFREYCRLTATVYLWRGPKKGSELQDYKKAAVYLGWLIDAMEGK